MHNEFVFLFLGTLIGVFLHMSWKMMMRTQKVQPQKKDKESDGEESVEDDWESGSDSEEVEQGAYRKNKGPE